LTHPAETLGLFALGVFAGGYGSMVGLGGGFLLVPAFLLLGFDPRVAAGTSMVVVLANGVSGTFTYLRQRRVDIRSGLVFAIAGFPGAWLGALVDQYLSPRLFSAAFAVLLLWIGIRLVTTTSRTHDEIEEEALLPRDDEPRPGLVDPSDRGVLVRDFRDAQGVRHTYRYNLAAGAAISVCGGFIASLFGIGGGIVQVPAMVYLFGFPAHVAVATSHFVIALTAFVGTASHAAYGDVRWPTALLVAAGAVVGAQIGTRLAKRVPAGPLMKLLAVGVVVTAVRLVWNAL
jgi:uncharacterized protein